MNLTTAELNQRFDAFLNQYDNKYVDDDGAYGNQCWDLVSRYVKQVIGCPSLPTRPGGNGGARDCYEIFMNPLGAYFERIAYTPGMTLKKGDIVVWGGLMGVYGHIAIIIDPRNGSGKFVSFDQNAPIGSKSHYVEHTFYGVIGILRPKTNQGGNDMAEPIVQTDDEAAELVRGVFGREPSGGEINDMKGRYWKERIVYLRTSQAGVQLRAMLNAFPGLQKQAVDLSNTVGDLNAQIAEMKKRPSDEEWAALQKKAEDSVKLANDLAAKNVGLAEQNKELLADKAESESVGKAFLRFLGDFFRKG